VINAIKFSIGEIEASDQYFDHTRDRRRTILKSAILKRSKTILDLIQDASAEKQAAGAQLRRKIEGCLYSAVAIFERAANDDLLTECREQFMPDHCNPHTMTQEALAAA